MLTTYHSYLLRGSWVILLLVLLIHNYYLSSHLISSGPGCVQSEYAVTLFIFNSFC